MYVCRNCNPTPPSPRTHGAILKLETPKINTCSMLDFQTSSSTLSSVHKAEFFILGVLYSIFPIVHNWVWVHDIISHTEWSSPANCSFNGFFDFFVFGRQCGIRHFVYISPQATPTSFPGLFPSCGGHPPREGKSPGNEVEATQTQFL